ncbi:CHAD domain-containing protein [Aquabacter spiritensis]|uniref:CHAD domain-containing protein n=1 Tax=Aquabacter spiritensis TaxID=933073 RepID=A0A4R3LK09_9HYPH|nr:CHAD domain-containing protein [Aquabacter spiritensis]TCT00563.1 CHAD domain-containing protein [Aquabacter spiritensis]
MTDPTPIPLPDSPRRRPSADRARRRALGPALVAHFAKSLDKVETALAETDDTRMVHDARKAIKEYRALLRLLDGAGPRAARRAAAEAARQLSAARDRQACRDALADLSGAGDLDSDLATAVVTDLGEDAPAQSDRPHHAAILRDWLTGARARHAEGLDAAARAADVMAGLQKGYAKARKADDFSTAERVHDLRKRVITHRYQMSFVSALTGGPGKRRAGRAQALRDILGAYQDIETLRAGLPGMAADGDRGDAVRRAAAARQETLATLARRKHARLFHRKPKAFAARLARKLAKAPLRRPDAAAG